MNWKEKARELISNAHIIEAIGVMESNGIRTGDLLSKAQELEDENEKHEKNKTQFTDSEFESYNQRFSELTWKLINML